jgi:hypothetical protein
LPKEQEALRFHYQSVELRAFFLEEVIQAGLTGLRPLLPLTKNGTRCEIVEVMFGRLLVARKIELVQIGYILASAKVGRAHKSDYPIRTNLRRMAKSSSI